jgi:hypothetical protein
MIEDGRAGPAMIAAGANSTAHNHYPDTLGFLEPEHVGQIQLL